MYLVDYVRFSNIQYLPKFHLLQYRALTTAKVTSWMQWNGLNNFDATTWQKLLVLISEEWRRHCQAACKEDFRPNSQRLDIKELPKLFYYGEDDYNI